MQHKYNVLPCAKTEGAAESVLCISPDMPGCAQSQKLFSSKFSDDIYSGFNYNVLLWVCY